MYEIIITRKTIEERPGGTEWNVIKKDDKGENIWGYTPEIMKKQEVSIQILKQNVEDLDLNSVIKAINKL